ncbi:MAG TPA: biotin/lipoyl-containing protein [Methanomassiliicoccales archaeon]|nr:biotin/lipoyl-containing protein [Methanomassiliicoccales archaeon]
MRIKVHLNGQEHEVSVEKNGGDYRVTVGDSMYKCAPKEGGLVINGEFLAIKFEGSLEEGTDVMLGGRQIKARVEPIIEVEKGESYSEEEETSASGKEEAGNITAPMPGKLISLKVKVGDAVEPSTLVAILEAMKMENEILAGVAGTVKEIKVRSGETVDGGKVLMVIG